MRPTNKTMQPAKPTNSVMSGPQIEMVGIAEDDLSAERFKRVLRDGLHGPLRANRHKHRRFDGLVRQRNAPAPAPAYCFMDDFETSAHQMILAARALLFAAKPHINPEACCARLTKCRA